MVNSKDVIIDILSTNGICIHREISDRARYQYKLRGSDVNRAIGYLYFIKAIDREMIDNPYGTKYSFYFLPENRGTNLNKILSYKLKLLLKHSVLTDTIGSFGEQLVGKVLADLDYKEIEYRKTQHQNIGIGRKGIDVWAKYPPAGYYQNFEVKNRRQPVDQDDVDNLRRKTDDAMASWYLPVESALVCSFIYPNALEYAKSKNIPVVITKKQFVPERFGNFYEEYKVAFGSYYVEAVNLQDPPRYLRNLIEEYIVLHEYDEPVSTAIPVCSENEPTIRS